MIGVIFAGIGDYDKADKYFRQSLNDEILSANVLVYSLILGALSRFTGQLKMLDTVCKKPEYFLICARNRLYIYVSRKEFDKEQQVIEVILNSGNKFDINDSVWVAGVYKNVGRERESIEIMEKSLNSFKNLGKKDKGFFPPFLISSIYAMLGEKEKAIDYCPPAAANFKRQSWVCRKQCLMIHQGQGPDGLLHKPCFSY